jgi:hypothetical protein
MVGHTHILQHLISHLGVCTMLRTSVLTGSLALATLVCLSTAANAANPSPRDVVLEELSAGDVLEVTTAKGRFQFEMVNAQTGETRGRAAYGSDPYGRERQVFVLGSTHGREALGQGMMLVQMHRVRVGMRLELGIGSQQQHDRQLTEAVRSIRVVPRTGDRVAMLVR